MNEENVVVNEKKEDHPPNVVIDVEEEKAINPLRVTYPCVPTISSKVIEENEGQLI